MKSLHIKYTAEFDIPLAFEGAGLHKQFFLYMESLIQQAILTQRFYLTKEGHRPMAVKPENLKIQCEQTIQDYQI